ncbi:MAG: hypothetical protein ACQEWU_20460 [Bacillota bacterium]
MNKVTRFIPSIEKGKYEEIFTKAAFTEILDELNLGEPQNTDIVEITESDEKGTVTEINKLLDYGNKAQVILKQYEAKLGDKTDTGVVVQLWVQNDDNVVVREYVNGELNLEQTVEEVHHVYKDYVKVPEVAEEHVELLAETMYDPASCIKTGSCCYFENQRYEHCGETCGRYHNAGGGTPINAIDRCCRTHDTEIRGKKGADRCKPHRNLINCMDGLKGPGDTTIRTGIRWDAFWNGCGLI